MMMEMDIQTDKIVTVEGVNNVHLVYVAIQQLDVTYQGLPVVHQLALVILLKLVPVHQTPVLQMCFKIHPTILAEHARNVQGLKLLLLIKHLLKIYGVSVQQEQMEA